MEDVVNILKSKGVLRSKKIEEALLLVDRKDFVIPQWKEYAYVDTAIPTMDGQTISQPYTVVFMLEKLFPKKIVVDVGAGSGWQTALLASIVGEEGKVYAYEINPKLLQFAKENTKKYPHLFKRIKWMSDAKKDFGGRFDSLICAASVDKELPSFWRKNLFPEGRLVYPQNQSIIVEKKNINGEFSKEVFPGFVFVPFI